MLEIKMYTEPVMREVAEPVTKITAELIGHINEMIELMRAENGIGLAAPQVGISKRFLVILNIKNRKDPGKLIVMINPKIVKCSETAVIKEEGCLSILGPEGPVFADVSRPESVSVEWIDENGEKQSADFEGFPARIVQHEIDHLDGKLFIDYLPSIKRQMVVNKAKKGKK
jgi:peptide deformylase